MNSFWYLLYNIIVIPFFFLGLGIARLWSRKVRLGLSGRKETYTKLMPALKSLTNNHPRFWIHCSSMGEYEQARPLIAALKQKFPDGSVIVSFFSPSAFEHIKDKGSADHLCYIPLDTQRRAARFLDILQPDAAVVVRHDFWPNHLMALKRRSIPCFLINCSINQTFTIPLLTSSVNRFLYSFFDQILTVSTEARDICVKHGWTAGTVDAVGDTRYDQVIFRARKAEQIVKPLRRIKGNSVGVVMGSTWPSDETVLFESILPVRKKIVNLWLVIVPHEPTREHLSQLETRLTQLGIPARRLSQIDDSSREQDGVLLVDQVGILASLYALGEICFVGGGFGPGIHNVLEPAALGKPVLFGPRNGNSYEAGQLKNRGIGFECSNAGELSQTLLSLLGDPARMKEIGKKAEELVQENAGATDRIVKRLKEALFPHD